MANYTSKSVSITGTLVDTNGDVVSGIFKLSANVNFVDSEGNLHLIGNKPEYYTITDGVVDVQLEGSDYTNPTGITWTLKFVRAGTTTEYTIFSMPINFDDGFSRDIADLMILDAITEDITPSELATLQDQVADNTAAIEELQGQGQGITGVLVSQDNIIVNSRPDYQEIQTSQELSAALLANVDNLYVKEGLYTIDITAGGFRNSAYIDFNKDIIGERFVTNEYMKDVTAINSGVRINFINSLGTPEWTPSYKDGIGGYTTKTITDVGIDTIYGPYAEFTPDLVDYESSTLNSRYFFVEIYLYDRGSYQDYLLKPSSFSGLNRIYFEQVTIDPNLSQIWTNDIMVGRKIYEFNGTKFPADGHFILSNMTMKNLSIQGLRGFTLDRTENFSMENLMFIGQPDVVSHYYIYESYNVKIKNLFLTTLHTSTNTAFSVDYSSNVHAENIHVQGAHLANSTPVEFVRCFNSSLKNVSISPTATLGRLKCYSNWCTTFDNMGNMQSIDAYENRYCRLNGIHGKNIDVSYGYGNYAEGSATMTLCLDNLRNSRAIFSVAQDNGNIYNNIRADHDNEESADPTFAGIRNNMFNIGYNPVVETNNIYTIRTDHLPLIVFNNLEPDFSVYLNPNEWQGYKIVTIKTIGSYPWHLNFSAGASSWRFENGDESVDSSAPNASVTIMADPTTKIIHFV